MSTIPTPTPGLYLDSCGTCYLATLHKRTGWSLTKQATAERPAAEPFTCPGFPENVKNGTFYPLPA